MQALQTHQLEWINTSGKRWELQNKTQGGEVIAAVTLHGEKWMPKTLSEGNEKAIGLPMMGNEAKAVAAKAAMEARGWQLVEAQVVEVDADEPCPAVGEILEVEFA